MKKFFEQIKECEVRNGLAFIIILGSISLLFCLQFCKVPDTNKDLIDQGIGFFLGGALSVVVMFYFGASKKDNSNQNEKL